VSSKTKKLISIVVPVFNEQHNIGPFYDAVSEVLANLADRYRFEIIFTDNHSTDETFTKLDALAARDERVRVARFSKNFGYQNSILTGYRMARGNAAIQLDCDLQDPPALMGEFLDKWEAGYRVVYGVRRNRTGGAAGKFARKTFYRLVNYLRSEEHTSELQSLAYLVCRLLLEKKKKKVMRMTMYEELTRDEKEENRRV